MTSDGTRAVRVDGDEATEIDQMADVGQVLRQGALAMAAEASGRSYPLFAAQLALPVLSPAKVICVGQNYRSHVEELGQEIPSYPTLFHKWPSALLAHGQPIELPPESSQVDWEGELVLVIGQSVRRATERQAEEAIAGYTIMCDTSMRDWQNRTGQNLQGKNWDRSTPVGPVVVTADQFNPEARVTTALNGGVVQHCPVSDLIFSPVELVQYISTVVRLQPGDLIATGTPSGVGHAHRPAYYLEAGDELSVSIGSIGTLTNPVRAEVV